MVGIKIELIVQVSDIADQSTVIGEYKVEERSIGVKIIRWIRATFRRQAIVYSKKDATNTNIRLSFCTVLPIALKMMRNNFMVHDVTGRHLRLLSGDASYFTVSATFDLKTRASNVDGKPGDNLLEARNLTMEAGYLSHLLFDKIINRAMITLDMITASYRNTCTCL
ncbi:hypothetical protein CAPTEDRAFT_205960 [Capitella teleta]|uniref:Uncharacterized protein n=1 Tax=Capitella teleta TaxID=283909 RepID=R7TD42_CAPTE|nr:hypothetical protein CAPTEDRAFT_205960 [Capitella teleta]|eukprot:ELT91402.1 hypothetical protein CAPTEDRAFT_205960 [Capitella teleta]